MFIRWPFVWLSERQVDCALGLRATVWKQGPWNRSCNASPGQLGPQWGRVFFTYAPFVWGKYDLRANNKNNLNLRTSEWQTDGQGANEQRFLGLGERWMLALQKFNELPLNVCHCFEVALPCCPIFLMCVYTQGGGTGWTGQEWRMWRFVLGEESSVVTTEPFPSVRRRKGARSAETERPCSPYPPPSPPPPPFRCHIAFLEWSASTGSAQDEMSYLRLILIS